MNFGKKGVYRNSSFLGMSSRKKIAGGSSEQRSSSARPFSAQQERVSLTCSIDGDGVIKFCDTSGAEASASVVEAAKKQNKDAILNLITRKCDEINEQVDTLGRLHHSTEDARLSPRFSKPPFDPERPSPPTLKPLGILGRLLSSVKRGIQKANAERQAGYEASLQAWDQEKKEFDVQCAARQELLERRIYSDLAAMEEFLDETLQDIAWPRETLISFDIGENGRRVMLDVDLPEVEDMPNRLAAVPARGLKLSVKELSPTKVQKLYMDHVHSLLFRLIGETFASLPTVQTVVASGFSQRRDPSTGSLRDDYLVSVRVPRTQWLQIDFNALEAVDPIEALARFEIVRSMSKTGVFKPVVPFTD